MTMGGWPAALSLLARHYAETLRGAGDTLPDPDQALAMPPGLAGYCSNLTVETLLKGYAKGLYPRGNFGPQKWWAPDERMVLFIENFNLGGRLPAKLRHKGYRASFDTDFEAVLDACSSPRPRQEERGWIKGRLALAFMAAHAAGAAHSVEIRDEDGALVGGAYGLAVGKVFFTEAQFSRAPDAGKIAFAMLNRHLQRNGFLANDAKSLTGALCQQGFSLVSRSAFNHFLEKACAVPAPLGKWAAEAQFDLAGWQPRLHAVA